MMVANPRFSNATENLSTKTAQYSTAQTNAEVLPAVAGKFYEIHAITIQQNNTTDTSISSGALVLAYLNAPSAAAAAGASSSVLHLDTPTATNIKISCGAGCFISIVYHLKA